MRERIKLADGLFLIGTKQTIYAEKTHNGKLWRRKAIIQMSAAMNARGKPTRELLAWQREFEDMVINADFRALQASRLRSSSPTVAQLCAAYLLAATSERTQHGEPRESTSKQNVCAFRRVASACGLSDNDRIDALTPERMEQWLVAFCGRYSADQSDRARVSAWAQLAQARSLWTDWTRPYYKRAGVIIPETVELWPRRKRDCSQCYQRPAEWLRQKTMRWYRRLERWHPPAWVACTLMLQFGMRNEDACELTWDAFHGAPGHWMLRYTPSKTTGRTASSRSVTWPVGDDIVARLRALGGKVHVIPLETRTGRYNLYQDVVNPRLRRIGWDSEHYGKASYELRKLCIDAIYRRYGLEKAVQISGDNAATVSKFYSDPTLTDHITVDVSAIV